VETAPAVRAGFALSAMPNPFRGSAVFTLSLPERTSAVPVIVIYNVRGQMVRTLRAAAGSGTVRQIAWDGNDGWGRALSSGLYFCTARLGNEIRKSSMALVR
jgi:flagellar hook assembly protein FlgD